MRDGDATNELSYTHHPSTLPAAPMFQEIPRTPPATPLLDRISVPADLRRLERTELATLAEELRAFLLFSVGQTGGHFGAGLGVIELTIALHYALNTPDDLLVWDVGHQAYPHKILTGRRDQMPTMRQTGGLAPFPQRDESVYDTFGVGHSSTSISAALGMAVARQRSGRDGRAVAVIGDGAMTAGMAFEALNHAADTGVDMLVVLNDNAMSISRNVGALPRYFARILSSKFYASVRKSGKQILSMVPGAAELARKTEEHMKGMVVPGTLFEELGFNYIGPIDGHDLEELVTALANVREQRGLQFLHVVTKKGKGYEPAEANPIKMHSLSKIEPQGNAPRPAARPSKPKFCNIFGAWLCDMAARDARVVGITPAMKEGSDLVAFAEQFPDRYFDTAIAEQHAVTFAAGLATQGYKPVVAIYSTFLQRAYDQFIHDVAIQELDVLFALDRAGLVEDGPTHSGVFDLSFTRCIPGMVVMTPADEDELRQMLYTGWLHDGPACVRYPRGSGTGVTPDAELRSLPIGRSRTVREGSGVAILSFGVLLPDALAAADRLGATVVDMRFVKPIDETIVAAVGRTHDLVVTLEENAVMGGAGSAVNECLALLGSPCPVLNIGIPDRFVPHGSVAAQRREAGLDADGIVAAVERWHAARTDTASITDARPHLV